MNIILTRPLNDIENLMNELFSLGHKIMHIPTLKIVNASLDPISIHNYKALIFTSSNAVRNIKIKEKRKNIKCFCVGSITEKIARTSGFTETISASGNINALKNLIINSKEINDKSKIAYFCGDNITYDLDFELKREGFIIDKFINYKSEKITDLNDKNKEIITNHSPDIIFVYSLRSAESFIEIVRNHSLYPLMTGSKVMCISEKVANVFKSFGWKKVEIFNPGEELLKL